MKTHPLDVSINLRRKWEDENVALAKSYADKKSYREASSYYDNAAHHRAIRHALQSERDK